MALIYNGTSPTAIKYNGTDLTVLKYGNTAVWGKPYSLSISAGSNTTVTVNRTSSPNQHATTGTLSSGSVVYYGDVLTISYSVSSGYAIETHTVNGTTFTSGQSFTVTSAISVVTTAVASISWKTIWTGNMNIAMGSPIDTGHTSQWTVRENSISISGLKANVPTRIHFTTFEWHSGKPTDEHDLLYTVNDVLYTTCGVMGYFVSSTNPNGDVASNQDSSYVPSVNGTTDSGESISNRVFIMIDTPTKDGILSTRDKCGYTKLFSLITVIYIPTCYITKIEQYY